MPDIAALPAVLSPPFSSLELFFLSHQLCLLSTPLFLNCHVFCFNCDIIHITISFFLFCHAFYQQHLFDCQFPIPYTKSSRALVFGMTEHPTHRPSDIGRISQSIIAYRFKEVLLQRCNNLGFLACADILELW